MKKLYTSLADSVFMNTLLHRITSSPSVLFGKPRIRGTRIPVQQVLHCLSQGWNYQQLKSQFPILKKTDIQACLAYASETLENIHIISYSSPPKVNAYVYC